MLSSKRHRQRVIVLERRSELLEIDSSAERPALASQHQNVDSLVKVGSANCGLELDL